MKTYLETFNQIQKTQSVDEFNSLLDEISASPENVEAFRNSIESLDMNDPEQQPVPLKCDDEDVRLTYYERSIREIDDTVNPMAVEAQMRLKYSTLDHLPREEFQREIKIYKQVIRDDAFYAKEAVDYPRMLCFENLSRFEKIEKMIAFTHQPAERTLKLIPQQ